MAFNVRIFGYRGLSQIPINKPTQFNADSVFQLEEPPLWRQVLEVNGATPVNSTAEADENAGAKCTVIGVEVPDGAAVRYEISSGELVEAGNTSRKMSGVQFYYFRSGWRISFVDAASFL